MVVFGAAASSVRARAAISSRLPQTGHSPFGQNLYLGVIRTKAHLIYCAFSFINDLLN